MVQSEAKNVLVFLSRLYTS